MRIPKARKPGRPWFERVNDSKSKGLAVGFRSGLEGNNAKHLEALNEPVLYETFKIKYAIPLSWHTYTPDFRLTNGVLVETKGIWDAKDRAKMLLVRMQYPDLDIRMVFTRANQPVNPGAKTTCREWAEKHGIMWAEKLIPVEWIKEKGPKVTPEEALRRGPIGYREILGKEMKAA